MTTPTLSHPGVYVQEEPSGVRAITGVATSITAFVGRALRGEVNRPLTITSWAEFEREFGGLWLESELGYSVSDFFRLGGSTAVVVRVFKGAAGDTAAISVDSGTKELGLQAKSPGKWGSKLTATVDRATSDPSDTTLFNVTVVDTGTGRTETFRNVSTVAGSSQAVATVINDGSSLVKVTKSPTTAVATPTTAVEGTTTGGGDGDAVTDDEYSEATGMEANKLGIYALEKVDLFNLLVVPPYLANGAIDPAVLGKAVTYAEKRDAVMIADPPANWTDKTEAVEKVKAASFTRSKNAALYFPRIRQPDPLRDSWIGTSPLGRGRRHHRPHRRHPGRVEGAGRPRRHARRGGRAVDPADRRRDRRSSTRSASTACARHRPPATSSGEPGPARATTLLASEWKYLPVRRTALFLKVSLFRGTQWVVFEPNDEPLWAQIRLNVGAFMNNLFRQGAFAGHYTEARRTS